VSKKGRGSRKRKKTKKNETNKCGPRNKFEVVVYDWLKRRYGTTNVGYETHRIEYILVKEYKPDFVVKLHDGSLLFVEAKGYFRPEDRRKILAVLKMNPDLKFLIVFQKDNRIRRGSKTRYSDWCKKHGIDYIILDKG